jgi:hypothetical protein
VSVEDGVRSKLDAVAARLDVVDARREAVFEAAKKRHGTEWMRRLLEIGREVTQAVPDPWPELSLEFDAVADAWHDATPEGRAALATALAAKKSLVDGHLGYVAHARRTLATAADAGAPRRVAAVVAMGRGGRDFRDVVLLVEDFVRVARAVGLDPTPDFERAAALAPEADSFGYGRGSTRDALLRFARAK